MAIPGNGCREPQRDGFVRWLVRGCDARANSCAYTSIFYRVESKPVTQLRLPLPWNPIYKSKWQIFLQALNYYLQPHPAFVSIAVAGPTASSAEIILPNGNLPPPGKTNPNNTGMLTLWGVSGATPVSVYTAWNCLLGNSYGVSGDCIHDTSYGAMSSYINSERAFIEEWAAAIDMYGGIFKGVTLVVTTGKGLPEFPAQSPGSMYKLPPPAFASDCGTTPTLDCAAETAILAYFAGPPIGGPNAKATQEDGLSASGGPVLSGLGVKWLSGATHAPGLSVLDSTFPAVVSRMLGGLQFATPFSGASAPEQKLLDTLQVYFNGTSVASAFGNTGTAMNGTQPVIDAPINYLQIYDDDIIYAGGLQGCEWLPLMSKPAKPGGPPPGCTVNTMMPKIPIPSPPYYLGTNLTAQDLLNIASTAILTQTTEPVTLGPLGCATGVPRGAFKGDVVCVSSSQQTQAAKDNAAATSPIPSVNTYASNYTDKSLSPLVPYGVCKGSFVYRQAYMGDYVCVTTSTASQVAADNAAFLLRYCYKFLTGCK
jgi:hypothetical protein